MKNKTSYKIMRYVCCLLFFCSLSMRSMAQFPVNNDCSSAIDICNSDTVFYNCCGATPTSCVLGPDVWYRFCVAEDMEVSGASVLFKSKFTNVDYTLYGPVVTNCSEVVPANIYAFGSSVPNPLVFNGLPAGKYFLRLHVEKCSGYVTTQITGFPAGQLCAICDDHPCEDCIGSFAPEPGKQYLLTAWVNEVNATLDKTSYNYPQIGLDFPGASTTLGPFGPSGKIIDGWQRLEQEFTIPLAATDINIQLVCATGDCLFDDIRIIPIDGSMKSYVYDPVTLRLVAELDERNYATFYEYDEEGKLMRIKKETERGIMTIQESKSKVVKK